MTENTTPEMTTDLTAQFTAAAKEAVQASIDEAKASARKKEAKATLDEIARTMLARDGARALAEFPGLGKVRYDLPGDWKPVVRDMGEFANHVVQERPGDVTATIELDATDLEAALAALAAAKIEVTSTITVPAKKAEAYLADVDLDVEGPNPATGRYEFHAYRVLGTGEVVTVPGVGGTRSIGGIVVTASRAAKEA